MNNRTSLAKFLQNEFDRRKKVNSQYSIRAFAKFLEVDSSSLSKVLSGKRLPSESHLQFAINKLNYQPVDVIELIDESEVGYLSKREFEVIANWEFFATLDLVILDNFQYDIEWMADQLNISKSRMSEVVERLLILGFLKEVGDKIIKTKKIFSNDIFTNTHEAQKLYQKQLLEKAISAIDNCDSSEKDITSMTIAVDPKRLEIAKEKIKAFRRELCAYLEEGDKTEVFHLSLQLCPARELNSKSENICV